MDYTRFGVSNYWTSRAYRADTVLSVDDSDITGTESQLEDITGEDEVTIGGNPSEDFLERFARYIGGESDDDDDDKDDKDDNPENDPEDFPTVVEIRDEMDDDELAGATVVSMSGDDEFMGPVTVESSDDEMSAIQQIGAELAEEGYEETESKITDTSSKATWEKHEKTPEREMHSVVQIEMEKPEPETVEGKDEEYYEEVGLLGDSEEESPPNDKDWDAIETEEFKALNEVLTDYGKFVYN